MMQTVVMLCLKLERVSIVNKIIKMIMCWITKVPGGRRRLCSQMKCSTSIKGNESMFNKTERLGGGGTERLGERENSENVVN